MRKGKRKKENEKKKNKRQKTKKTDENIMFIFSSNIHEWLLPPFFRRPSPK